MHVGECRQQTQRQTLHSSLTYPSLILSPLIVTHPQSSLTHPHSSRILPPPSPQTMARVASSHPWPSLTHRKPWHRFHSHDIVVELTYRYVLTGLIPTLTLMALTDRDEDHRHPSPLPSPPPHDGASSLISSHPKLTSFVHLWHSQAETKITLGVAFGMVVAFVFLYKVIQGFSSSSPEWSIISNDWFESILELIVGCVAKLI